MATIVDVFPARTDNLGYLVHDEESGATAAIDAPEEGPILEALARRGWQLSDILVTHHHKDHTEALLALKERFGARATGPAAEAGKIAGLDRLVTEGDTVRVGQIGFRIIAVPGHTLGHIAYHDPRGGHLFAGDALFSLGCGRMIEGRPEPMWEGLRRLRDLPGETLLYCGHDYTRANGRFALSVDPDNQALQARAREADAQAAGGVPTLPTPLASEAEANPFLRADTPGLARALAMEGAPPAAVFAALRARKDAF